MGDAEIEGSVSEILLGFVQDAPKGVLYQQILSCKENGILYVTTARL